MFPLQSELCKKKKQQKNFAHTTTQLRLNYNNFAQTSAQLPSNFSTTLLEFRITLPELRIYVFQHSFTCASTQLLTNYAPLLNDVGRDVREKLKRVKTLPTLLELR